MRKILVYRFLLVFFSLVSGDASQPRAHNLTWTSFNFKTILTWSSDSSHTYTVEFSKEKSIRQKNPYCIQISHNECDLTNDLSDLKANYTADVLTELINYDPTELPFTQSEVFNPYSDTVIGAPQFSVQSDENGTITLHIADQQTALYRDGRHLTLRDVFKHDLKYSIMYNKAGSTGMRSTLVQGGEVVIQDVERGPSYCFRVSVSIMSRKSDRKLAKWTLPRCSPALTFDLFEEFDPVVVSVGILAMVALVLVMIVVIVCCCRRRRGSEQAEQNHSLKEV